MTAEISPETLPSEADLRAQKRGKRTLMLILGVSILPIALAYLAFFTGIGIPQNTVNSGVLIPKPTKVESLVPAEFWQSMEADKKWHLMIPLGPQCNAHCEENLYTTRQVHIRLGEKSPRLDRFVVNYGGAHGEAYLKKIAQEHPQLKYVTVDPRIWQDWQAGLSDTAGDLPSDAGHHYYMLDQEGVAMMIYTDQPGNDLLKDIKRALKYSIDYQ